LNKLAQRQEETVETDKGFTGHFLDAMYKPPPSYSFIAFNAIVKKLIIHPHEVSSVQRQVHEYLLHHYSEPQNNLELQRLFKSNCSPNASLIKGKCTL
jgi:hypothetical protein